MYHCPRPELFNVLLRLWSLMLPAASTVDNSGMLTTRRQNLNSQPFTQVHMFASNGSSCQYLSSSWWYFPSTAIRLFGRGCRWNLHWLAISCALDNTWYLHLDTKLIFIANASSWILIFLFAFHVWGPNWVCTSCTTAVKRKWSVNCQHHRTQEHQIGWLQLMDVNIIYAFSSHQRDIRSKRISPMTVRTGPTGI